MFLVKSVIALYNILNLPLFLQVFDIETYFDKSVLKDGMDSLFRCQVDGKLYRLWYKMNRNNQIKVKTAAGVSNVEATGENITQGSVGSGILSSASLDKTMTRYFDGSQEISYVDLRLSPINFQDDSARLSDSVENVQKGNIIMESVMKRKQLSLNISKCCVIPFEKGKKREELKKEINSKKIFSLCGETITAKDHYVYLGETLHGGGLSKSAEMQ